MHPSIHPSIIKYCHQTFQYPPEIIMQHPPIKELEWVLKMNNSLPSSFSWDAYFALHATLRVVKLHLFDDIENSSAIIKSFAGQHDGNNRNRIFGSESGKL